MPDAKLPHAQGKPCWLDMFAEDQSAAIAFYNKLFGWVGEPNAEFGGYAVLSLDGRAVAGISPRMPDQPPQPPAWNTYFAVDDIEAVAERIGKLGGTKFVGPDEVPGTGRLVFASDPAGAPFGLWEAAPFPGFQAAMEPGAPVWFELETRQGESSAEFYAALLGVEAPTSPEMAGSYWVVTVGGEQAAGIWQDPEGGADWPAGGPHWQPYFQVADADATVAAAVAAGATVVREAQDSPYGRFAKLRDPQGAGISVITAMPS
jgi:predicted enzyme related to lactoylglutathione lyase